MTEPRPLPPLPRPFAGEPRQLSGPGCGRGVWIGCGGALVLFLIAAIALSRRADEMMVWMLGKVEESVAANLPADLTSAERERFGESFDALARAVEAGEVDPRALQKLQGTLFALSNDLERGLTRERVLELTAAVEQAAGIGAEETPGEEPAAPESP